MINSNTKGNVALGQAIAYFTSEYYTVSIPLNDCQYYDLIIEKNSIFQTVQVKYTSQISSSGKYVCKLITTSPNTGKELYSLVEKPLDLLYCFCSNGDMFLIPVKEITTRNQITLYTKTPYNVNEAIFDTSKYFLNKEEKEEEEIPNIEKIDNNLINIKNVYQYSLEGIFIKKFNNCCEAARAIKPELIEDKKKIYNIATNISRVCRGERQTAYKYQWKYS